MSADARFIEDDLKGKFQAMFKFVDAGSDLDVHLRQMQMTVIAMARKIEELQKNQKTQAI